MVEVEWRPVVGWEGWYDVSSDGQVRRVDTGIVLKQTYSHKGYKLVGLSKFVSGVSIHKTYRVHRLVAEAFIPNPENKPWVDHINTIRDDNRKENLMWCTPTENNHNPVTKGKQVAGLRRVAKTPEHRAKMRRAKAPTKRPVRCIETREIWGSVKEAAEANKTNLACITKSCKRSARGVPHREYRDTSKAARHYEYVTPKVSDTTKGQYKRNKL